MQCVSDNLVILTNIFKEQSTGYTILTINLSIMKKLILLSVVCCVTLSALKAQQPNIKSNTTKPIITAEQATDLKLKNNCCTATPFTITACAQSLLQSFKNLTAGVGASNCHASLNYPMPENCFTHQTTSASMVTYSSFYVPGISELYGAARPGNLLIMAPVHPTQSFILFVIPLQKTMYLVQS
jgi:hypothetical protein